MIIHTSLLTSADFLHVSSLNPKTTLINVIKMLNVHLNSLVFKCFDDRDNLTRSHSDETSLNKKTKVKPEDFFPRFASPMDYQLVKMSKPEF